MIKLLILLLLTFSLSSAFSTEYRFEENQYRYEDYIYDALQRRNKYFEGIIPLNNRIKAYNNPDTWIQQIKPERTPWYFFLKGINEAKKGRQSNQYFHRAIKEANYELGDLWALFVEFEKIDLREWSQATVEEIQKALTTSGSDEAPTIVNQLLILARQSKEKKEDAKATYYIETSLLFTNTTSPILASALLSGIEGNETKITPVTVVSTYMAELKESWYLQTHLYKAIFTFLRAFIYVATVMIFIILFVKYYPKVIHMLACKYPLSVPYKVRLVFISMLLFPVFFFGGYIAALVTSFALLMYIDSKQNKRLIGLAIIGFILYPVSTYPEAFFEKLLSERAVHNLYYQSIHEIPSHGLATMSRDWQDLDLKEKVIPTTKTQKALLYTTEAIVNFKQNRQSDAQFFINKALDERPNFQPTLIAASVINAVGKNTDIAEEQFLECTEIFPELAEVHFNYNRWLLETKISEHNEEHLNKATTLAKEKVRNFIDMNTLYYGANIPFTRRYFISQMNSKTFWKNRKEIIGPLTPKASKLWGKRFLGLRPLQTVSVLASIFVILLIRLISTSSRRSTISKCTLCGRPTCKHCKCAEYCNECNTLIKSISNESLIESMKIKISINKRLTARIIGISTQMLIPGSAAFFINGKPPLRMFPMLIITMLVYTGYMVIFSYTFSLFPEKSLAIQLTVLGVLSLYNIFFILQFFRSLKYEKSAGKA